MSFLFGLLVTGAALANPADIKTGHDLQAACLRADKSDCDQFIRKVVETEPLAGCVPHGVSKARKRSIVLRYIATHPHAPTFYADFVAGAGLEEAYPCA